MHARRPSSITTLPLHSSKTTPLQQKSQVLQQEPQASPFVSNNFQDVPPPSYRKSMAYKVPYILPSSVSSKSFCFTHFRKLPGVPRLFPFWNLRISTHSESPREQTRVPLKPKIPVLSELLALSLRLSAHFDSAGSPISALQFLFLIPFLFCL